MQRVSRASVRVDGREIARIGSGMVVLAAVHREDTQADAARLADRVVGLRIFGDAEGKMNVAIRDLESTRDAGILAVSNFTVYGDTSKSRRPSFTASAGFEKGRALFEAFVRALREMGVRVETGEFGAMMEVELANDGPVTVIVEAGPSS